MFIGYEKIAKSLEEWQLDVVGHRHLAKVPPMIFHKATDERSA